jgi:hypothetical protein
MRYLVTGRIKPGKESSLFYSIENESLGRGSIAFGEYVRNMKQARLINCRNVRWVEVCYCSTPLMEEIPYWEEYFELTDIRDAHGRHNCKDLNGEAPWACSSCECTKKLEAKLETKGVHFLEKLKEQVSLNTDELPVS